MVSTLQSQHGSPICFMPSVSRLMVGSFYDPILVLEIMVRNCNINFDKCYCFDQTKRHLKLTIKVKESSVLDAAQYLTCKD